MFRIAKNVKAINVTLYIYLIKSYLNFKLTQLSTKIKLNEDVEYKQINYKICKCLYLSGVESQENGISFEYCYRYL